MRCRPVPEEVRRAADLLERRWTISILYASYDGATRFNEFRQALGPIPPATLATRLVELADASVLERVVVDARPPLVELADASVFERIVVDARPPIVEYRLTPRGQALQGAVEALVRATGT